MFNVKWLELYRAKEYNLVQVESIWIALKQLPCPMLTKDRKAMNVSVVLVWCFWSDVLRNGRT